MSKIKVVMVVTGFPTKENPSHGIFNKKAAELLSEKVDLNVIQLRIWKPGREFSGRINNNEKYIHYYLSAPYMPLVTKRLVSWPIKFYYRLGSRKFPEILNEADVLHSVGASFAGALASMWSAKYKKKHVLQIIGSDVNSELPGMLNIRVFKDMTDFIHGVSCNSEALMKAYLNILPAPEFIDVIYRGIDTKKFEYSFPEIKNDNIRFLFLGGIPEYKYVEGGRNLKGGMTLMNAWKRLDSRGEIKNCELLFAGPDSNSHVAAQWRDTLKHPENVKLMGKLPPISVKNLYLDSHVVLIPSLEEGMPNVAMEAGASGKCVIASNVGGIPELIDNNLSGLLVEPGNTDQLIETIIKLIKEPALIKKYGAHLRKRIENDFSNSNFPYRMISLYKKVLNQVN